LIEFSQVSMVYQTGTHALKNVNFKIIDGEFVFVIGRSGAGKSTLIKLLTCEERPTSGRVLIDSYNISTIRNRLIPYLRRNIGMVFQDFRLIDTKTVFENVAFAMEIVGASNRTIRRRVPIVLSIVGLREKAGARPGELSGGEQQRVAIARAMVNNPMIILADEPTGNLDPTNSEAIMAILQDINRSGTTVIICTHDRVLVDRMKLRVIEINDGILVRDDNEGAYFCDPPGSLPIDIGFSVVDDTWFPTSDSSGCKWSDGNETLPAADETDDPPETKADAKVPIVKEKELEIAVT
jgi:cell division transport system ATP-binding protein